MSTRMPRLQGLLMRYSSHKWMSQKRKLACCCNTGSLLAGLRGLGIRRFSQQGEWALWERGGGVEVDEVQSFKIQTGSAGSITVDLHNLHLLAKPTTPLYIYLPPHGNHHQSSISHSLPSFLPSGPKALAKINYRWNHTPSSPRNTSADSYRLQPSPSPPLLSCHPNYVNYPFPTPLHDVLHAFVFLTTSLLQTFSSKTTSAPPDIQFPYHQHTSKQPQRPLILTGTLHGATLATSLALTESQTNKSLPYYIAALLVKNGIFDWSPIATSLPPLSSSLPPSNSWDASTLHSAKNQLFTKPEQGFDQFISPILFFRTSGHNVPPKWRTVEDENPSQPAPADEEYYSFSEEQDTIYDNFPPEETSDSDPPPTSSFTDSSADIENPLTSKSKDIPTPDHPFPPQQEAITTPSPEDPPWKAIKELAIAPPSKKSHLRFPPKSSERQLKIPRSLFLVSPDPSVPCAIKDGKRMTSNGEKRELELGDFVTPREQAEELATLMRRSVSVHEFEDRRRWDDELDAEGESEARVQVQEVGEGEAAEVVREWMEEILDS